ncbi:maleylpyruvate isomerase N-terminal domain-containing protein [Pseudarthrobacter quantipunctorum]|uniref:maleylpyruvate isomerase N-terminal domain-containing protein n=1 Tax=Pseudarthrobacter quantipunctorum TaxID=3128980 RepID=UPI003873C744
MRASAATVWQVVHSASRRLGADLSGLPDEQRTLASLCPGWEILDVPAHMVNTARTSRLPFARDLVMARKDFDRARVHGIAREKRQDPQESLSAFTEVAGFTRTPPKERLDGSGASRLIRAAAGTSASYERQQLTPAERVP